MKYIFMYNVLSGILHESTGYKSEELFVQSDTHTLFPPKNFSNHGYEYSSNNSRYT